LPNCLAIIQTVTTTYQIKEIITPMHDEWVSPKYYI